MNIFQSINSRPRKFGISLLLLIFLAIHLVFVSNSNAQEESEIILASEELATSQMSIIVGKGKIIRFERPVASIFVADPEVADVQAYSPTLVYVFGRSTGTTTIFAVDNDEEIVLRQEVRVSHAVDALSAAIAGIVPNDRVSVSSIANGLLLEGVVRAPGDITDIVDIASTFLGENERVVNRLQSAGSIQVNLQVRVAELSRSVTKLFGINVDSALAAGDTFFSFLSGRSFLSEDRSTFSRLVDSSGPANALLGSFASNDFVIDGIIDALETEGLASVLAQPNLTALSGETATFLAGGEFPVPVGSNDDDVEIQFREFGVRLAFTPTVLSSDRISLRVRPEVSDLDFSNALELSDVLVPALTTRRAETTIELGSGQSFAIGGLISNSTDSNIEKVPGLGDVPVLGTLFRSSQFQKSESELVIIVTPYLVKPTTPDQLSLPNDDLVIASDLDRILNGRLRRDEVATGRNQTNLANGIGLTGPAGFIIE